MKKCSKNCPDCPGTDEDKKGCPEWITTNLMLDISQDLKKLKNAMVNAMVDDFKKDVMVEDDDDDIEQYTDVMYKHHDKYFT